MASQDSLIARVEKLERQNRRMKLIGFGSLIVAGAILLMGQVKQTPVLSEVRARSFTLVDSNGKIRAWIGMAAAGPTFAIYDAQGNSNTILSDSGLSLSSPNKAGLLLQASPGGPQLILADPDAKRSIGLDLTADGPSVTLDDANGFETQIGVSNLESPTTGETSKTSAASIKLFGKDRKVLWSAP